MFFCLRIRDIEIVVNVSENLVVKFVFLFDLVILLLFYQCNRDNCVTVIVTIFCYIFLQWNIKKMLIQDFFHFNLKLNKICGILFEAEYYIS